jgi:hypothetical protein
MSLVATAGQLSHDVYDPIPKGRFLKTYRIGETVCATAIIDGIFWIANQGTELEENGEFSIDGWGADFDAFPIYHSILGNLHSGFDKNLPTLVKALLLDIPYGMPVINTGHSKGGGEGGPLAARLKIAGVNVLPPVLFASPNSGYQRFADWLAENLPGGLSYRNGIDCVPEVPIEPFVPPYQHIGMHQPPGGIKDMIPTCWHDMQLYLQGALAL